VNIPKGWKKLRKGMLLVEGDKYWCNSYWEHASNWKEGRRKAGDWRYVDNQVAVYIRRIKKKAKK